MKVLYLCCESKKKYTDFKVNLDGNIKCQHDFVDYYLLKKNWLLTYFGEDCRKKKQSKELL